MPQSKSPQKSSQWSRATLQSSVKFCQRATQIFSEVHDECVPPRRRKREKELPLRTLIKTCVSNKVSVMQKKVWPQKPFAIVQNGRHYALSEKWGTAILCGSRKNGEKSHWPGLRQIDSSIDFPCTAAVHRSLLWLHWPISEKKNSGLLWIKPKCLKRKYCLLAEQTNRKMKHNLQYSLAKDCVNLGVRVARGEGETTCRSVENQITPAHRPAHL